MPGLICPFCNAKGQKQPVLSPMETKEVLADVDGKKTKYKVHRCPRCQYSEIPPKSK